MEEAILRRINETIEFFGKRNDHKGLKLTIEAIEKAVDYVSSVTKMEIGVKVKKITLEGNDFRETVEELDARRNIAHEALLTSCTILNRYYKNAYPDEFPLGGIFGLPKEKLENFNRQTAADWAMVAVKEIFADRQYNEPINLNRTFKFLIP